MYFFTLVVGICFFPKVNTLSCYECSPGTSGSCTNTQKQCPQQAHQCGAISIMTYTGGSKDQDLKTKKCALAQECVGGSVNFGSQKTVISSSCCSTDLCNTKVTEPKLIPNGKKCFSCEGQKCTRTLNCEGDEDYCIKSTINLNGKMTTMKGCASKMMCIGGSPELYKKYVVSESTCCQGDYCNSASSTKAGWLLLLVLLTCSILFS